MSSVPHPLNSNRFDIQQVLHLDLRPSYYFVIGFSLLLISTLWMIWQLPLSFWLHTILSTGTLGWGGHTLLQHGFYYRHPLYAAQILETQLQLLSGEKIPINIRSYVRTHFIVLFACPPASKMAYLFIFPDAHPAFWQLRYRLLHIQSISPASSVNSA